MSSRTVLSRYPLLILSIKAVNELEPFVFTEGSDVMEQLFEYTKNFIVKNVQEMNFDRKECNCSKTDEKSSSKKKKKSDVCIPTDETFMNMFYTTTTGSNFVFLNYGILFNEFRVNLNEKLDSLPYQNTDGKKLKLEILNCKEQIVFSFSNFENVTCDSIKILSDETEAFRRQIPVSDDLDTESLEDFDSDSDEYESSDDETEDTESEDSGESSSDSDEESESDEDED